MTNYDKIEMIRRINCLNYMVVNKIYGDQHILDKFNDASNNFKFVMSLDNTNLGLLFSYFDSM